MNKSALVVFSGGQDSTTCLYWALERFSKVCALTVNYGQRHQQEILAARTITGLARVPLEIVEIPAILRGASPLTNPDKALETYSSPEQMADIIGTRVEITFVPMRNPFFLTLAMNRAIADGHDAIITGVCQEDNANYPDCRRSFVDSFATMAAEALGAPAPTIETPLMNLTKADTVRLALRTPGCYEGLAWSHTAYSGEYPPVTNDHATVLRAQGFRDAGVPDPLLVRAAYHGLCSLPDEDHYRPFVGMSVAEVRQQIGAADRHWWGS